jgi:acetamidase/formamidase
VLSVESGDTVVVAVREVTDNQITRNATSADLRTIDESRLYPLTGPICVKDAEPGDTLAIEVLDLRPGSWGWSAILPGEGLLPDDFDEPHLKVFDLSDGDLALFREDIAIPIEPFLGTMGVCPAEARMRPIMPPGTFGGNIDTRQLTRGATLFLPVQVRGALFSCGDGHAAQGDGEVCVTAVETSMEATLRFVLDRGRSIPAPQYLTPAASSPRLNTDGSYGTTGVGPDLYAAAQDAVRAMIDHLSGTYALSREDAYVLASLCVDLRISEVVDAGEYVVSALFPLAVVRA